MLLRGRDYTYIVLLAISLDLVNAITISLLTQTSVNDIATNERDVVGDLFTKQKSSARSIVHHRVRHSPGKDHHESRRLQEHNGCIPFRASQMASL